MAENYLEVALLNPFWIVDKDRELPSQYHQRHFDGWLAEEQKLKYEQGPCYYQPWQQDDTTMLQVKANYDPISIRFRNEMGLLVFQDHMINKATLNGITYFESNISFNLSEGIYTFEIVGGDPVQKVLRSQKIWIKREWPGTILLNYSNAFNTAEILWQTGITFNYRVIGNVPPTEFLPLSNRTVYVDQPNNAKTVYGVAARQFKLFFGNEIGVPPFVPDLIEEIFDQTNVLIDGKRFSAIDGAKQTPKKFEKYYMAQWSMDIRETLNKRSKRFTSTGIVNEKITQDYFTSLKLFGPQYGSANDNSAIITVVE